MPVAWPNRSLGESTLGLKEMGSRYLVSVSTTPVYEDLLADLFERQLPVSDDEYLRLHSNNRAVIRRHADAFRRCERFVVPGRASTVIAANRTQTWSRH